MKIALFYKKDKLSSDIVESIKESIHKHGFELDDARPDVVLFVGGDGTFLRSVQHYINELDKIRFIGLCKGHLGFFYSYNEDDLDALLNDLSKSEVHEEQYRLLTASVDGEPIYALNEIRIESPFHSLISDVYVNDEFMETFRGNGLVVSSSIGSSAYNKSLGGAVVSPKMNTIQLTEIAPINNTIYTSLHSSFVLDENSYISLKTKTENILVGYDFLTSETKFASEIRLSLSNKVVHTLYKKDYSYTKLLKTKFVGNK